MPDVSQWPERHFDVAGLPDSNGASFAQQWQRLHAGDVEPLPDSQCIAQRLDNHPALVEALEAEGVSTDAKQLSSILLDAWQHFHAGRFASARQTGLKAGALGLVVAGKASNIHASYLCDSEDEKLALFQEVADWGERLVSLLPIEDGAINALYMQAYALGRYSQMISITQALKEGLGNRVKKALETVLDADDQHAEAHTALGLYHAEIIDKIGGMIGGLTYGAKKETGVAHFQKAIELCPQSAIAHIEYANGLLMMFGDKKLDQATELYITASKQTPQDAMEMLDVELAQSELED